MSKHLVEAVSSYQEVRDNIMQFNKDLQKDESLCRLLSLYRNWYYLPQLDMFAPGKFIGYKEMNSALYNLLQQANRNDSLDAKKRKIMDGRKTSRLLYRWFTPVEKDEYKLKLMEKLATFLELYGKNPNKKSKIFLPR